MSCGKYRRAIEYDAVRNPDVADRATGPGRGDRLFHRLLRPHALEHGVGAHAARQFFDARHAFLATLGDYVGRTELSREFLPRFVSAHRNDPFRAHVLRGEHAQQSDGSVADDDGPRARLDVRRIPRVPAGAHHVRQRV